MEKKVGEFEVISVDGAKYVIYEWKKRIDNTNLGSASRTHSLPQLATLRTSDGLKVSPSGEGKFHILDLDIICEKIEKE